MIKVICIGHNYEYEVRELLKVFYKPEETKIEFVQCENYSNLDIENSLQDLLLINKLSLVGDKAIARSSLNGEEIIEEALISDNHMENTKVTKNLVKRSIFKLLKKFTDVKAPWGVLTGIRPSKIVHDLLNKGYSRDKILLVLTDQYCIYKDKAELLLNIAETEHRFVYPIDEAKVSIYISIPFCPTRCLYCSFPSNPLKESAHLVDAYLDALCREIREVGNLIQRANKKVETIYIGGGTPTSLSALQFSRIFETIKQSINLDFLKEFTVEAGRPDTIDLDKLALFKGENVTRISINPQTMNDCTLKAIGRDHTVKELVESYKMAAGLGFRNINMDIIIGLPGEDLAAVQRTMEEIKKLSPTNLTVHTLAIKRTSRLREKEKDFSLALQEEVIDMLELTQTYAESMGLRPYYMYRQKHMVGNLENIGYAKPGYECIYNIQIMEEKQTIIALGAGGVSKFTFPWENRLERVPNVKNLDHYINRIDEMIERKAKFM